MPEMEVKKVFVAISFTSKHLNATSQFGFLPLHIAFHCEKTFDSQHEHDLVYIQFNLSSDFICVFDDRKKDTLILAYEVDCH